MSTTDEKITTSGIEMIAAERFRQIGEEGWTPEHDDEHGDGSIAQAAACYAAPEAMRDYNGALSERQRRIYGPIGWPWRPQSWKPTPEDRVRELVKAGALIAAEIDRLHRADGAALAEITENAQCAMVPVKTEACNFVFHLPGRPGEGDLACVRDLDARTVTSFWRPEGDLPEPGDPHGDDGSGGRQSYINVAVSGGYAPPITLGISSAGALDDIGPEFVLPDAYAEWPGHAWAGIPYDAGAKELLDAGGYVFLRVHQCPPPPVQVWIA